MRRVETETKTSTDLLPLTFFKSCGRHKTKYFLFVKAKSILERGFGFDFQRAEWKSEPEPRIEHRAVEEIMRIGDNYNVSSYGREVRSLPGQQGSWREKSGASRSW